MQNFPSFNILPGRSPHGERGLKLRPVFLRPIHGRRSPHGERGLKYWLKPILLNPGQSLPAWGAWIEIKEAQLLKKALTSLPAWGAWIEIPKSLKNFSYQYGRSPHGERGLKSPGCAFPLGKICRSPHGERGLKSGIDEYS